MKATLLLLCSAIALFMGGCESDLPPNPNQPAVAFGNNKFRDEGMERPANLATDRERNVW
jgi:hypothetical protein